MSAGANSLVIQFIAETRDNLDDAARGLLALENSAADQDLINSIFRSFHTIKGTSGIFPEFQAITTLTHAAEELMDLVRNGRMQLTSEHVDLFLAALDLVGSWLETIEATGQVPADALQSGAPLREKFLAFLHRETGQPVAAAEAAPATPPPAVPEQIADWLANLPDERLEEFQDVETAGQSLLAICYRPDESCFFFGDDPVNLVRQMEGIRLLQIVPGPAPESPDDYDPFTCCLAFHAVLEESEERVRSVFAYVEDQLQMAPFGTWLQNRGSAAPALRGEPETEQAVAQAQQGGDGARKSAAPAAIRIDQALINRFVDLVGEMIIAKNSLPYLGRRARTQYGVRQLAEEIETNYGTINQIVENLQDIALEMRMLPVAKAFERFPRLVRDISAKLGKKIGLVMEGEETKADKDVIEALSEPLVHMVRNSLDHGIETPDERMAAGKPAEGTIRLSAFQENASIVVEIIDDGRGIDPAKIRKKAAEKGITSSEALAAMADEEVIQLIMAPNFSTADAISDLSGRGVGMDVVNSMVVGFGGSVQVFSQTGSGSRIRMSLPLSMAITKILIIRQGECTFGIPSTDVVETLSDVSSSRISTVRGAPGLEVRGDLVPLYQLPRQLAIPGTAPFRQLDGFSVVVARVRGETVALIVDSFCDIIDVVVKPLEGMLASNRYYSGSTILGDGTIMFMLNLPEVISYAD